MLSHYAIWVALNQVSQWIPWNFRWLVTDKALKWRHNEHDGVSNHQPHDCLLNRLFRRRSQKAAKLRVTGLCAGNSPVTGEFPAQSASNAENVSIWWRHHAYALEPGVTRWSYFKMFTLCLSWVQYIDGLMQKRRNSSALAMELCLFCTKPSIYCRSAPRQHRVVIHFVIQNPI